MRTAVRDQRPEVSGRASVWSAPASAPLSRLALNCHRSQPRERRPGLDGGLFPPRFLRDLLCGGSSIQSAGAPARSKTWRLRLILLCLLTAFYHCAQAQYSLDWWTVESGGGQSTGSVFTVTGTIGQPDAGAMSGGNFSLVGGFWSVIAAVQTPGAPLLRIYHTNGMVTVAWAKPAEGWVLERTNALPATVLPWPLVPLPYQTNAADIFIITSAPSGNAFFRLYKP
jgi:hypothetical protein